MDAGRRGRGTPIARLSRTGTRLAWLGRLPIATAAPAVAGTGQQAQTRKIVDDERAALETRKALTIKKLQRTTDVDRCQAERVGELFMRRRNGDFAAVNHAAVRKAVVELDEQRRGAGASRAPSECGKASIGVSCCRQREPRDLEPQPWI